MKTKAGLILNENEEVVAELEAELWASSSNPIAKFFGSILRIIALICGVKKRGFLVITNQRVVEIKFSKLCWIFNSSREFKIVLPSSIKEVGYLKSATFCGCFCQAYKLYYESYTQTTEVLLSTITSDEEAQKLAEAFYNAINYRQ